MKSKLLVYSNSRNINFTCEADIAGQFAMIANNIFLDIWWNIRITPHPISLNIRI